RSEGRRPAPQQRGAPRNRPRNAPLRPCFGQTVMALFQASFGRVGSSRTTTALASLRFRPKLGRGVMYASRSRFPKEPYQGNEVVPFVTKEWPAAEDAGPARDLDAEADQRNGRRRVEPSIRSVRQSVKNSQVAGAGPSIGRRMVRRFVRF